MKLYKVILKTYAINAHLFIKHYFNQINRCTYFISKRRQIPTSFPFPFLDSPFFRWARPSCRLSGQELYLKSENEKLALTPDITISMLLKIRTSILPNIPKILNNTTKNTKFLFSG